MKKKIAQKFHKFKIEGLTKRWLTNIIGIIFILLIIVFVVASFSIKTFYYNSVESILNSGSSSWAVNYFASNLDTGTSLESSAAQFIDSYSYKDKTTVWVINNEGTVIASSDGFINNNEKMPDYESAISKDRKSVG